MATKVDPVLFVEGS